MVHYGYFCKNTEFEITGYPQSCNPQFEVKVYKVDGDSRAYTLHVLVKSTELVDHASTMSVNEKGLPSCHFHAHACEDANEPQGIKSLNNFKIICHAIGHWARIKVESKLAMFICTNFFLTIKVSP